MLNSIKRKLSKKGSKSDKETRPSDKPATSSSGHLTASNPVTSNAPPTRRPASSSMNPFSSGPDEAPPAYTITPGPAAELPAITTIVADSDSDPYAFLKSFDIVFLIDDSGSMAGSRWRETSKALGTITPICTARDADGIDLYFLNHPDSDLYKNVRSAGTITEIFQTVRPRGATPTGQRLNFILKRYMDSYKLDPEHTKPINIIVLTDGEPADDVESPIVKTAKKLDQMDAPQWQVGIQFVQVGNEPGAREALKVLDDGLAEVAGNSDLRDIVDTVPFRGEKGGKLSAAGILKVVLGSVNRRLDRSSKEIHREE